MIIETKSLNDITQEAISILNKTIGISNTLRFLNQFTTGHGDYTEERKKVFEKMTMEDIVRQIKKNRANNKS
jgi:hypothetical protein